MTDATGRPRLWGHWASGNADKIASMLNLTATAFDYVHVEITAGQAPDAAASLPDLLIQWCAVGQRVGREAVPDSGKTRRADGLSLTGQSGKARASP